MMMGMGLVVLYIRAGSFLISKSPLEDFIIWTLYISYILNEITALEC